MFGLSVRVEKVVKYFDDLELFFGVFYIVEFHLCLFKIENTSEFEVLKRREIFQLIDNNFGAICFHRRLAH